MELVNLTHHPVTLEQHDGRRLELAPSGVVARVSTESRSVGGLARVPVVELRHGRVLDLPAAKPGRVYIVSLVVAAACRHRDDVVAPDTSPESAIRDRSGRIVAVRRLATFQPS